MADRGLVIGLALIMAVAALTSGAVQARIQDYQILRLLSDKTGCNPEHVEPTRDATGVLAFHATCQDVTFYPDGVDIICPDQDDDRACRILNQKQTFKTLDLLRQK